MVHEAVLSSRPEGSVWILTLRPVVQSGAVPPTDPNSDREVAVSPERIDEMEFGISYTLEEIDTLLEG